MTYKADDALQIRKMIRLIIWNGSFNKDSNMALIQVGSNYASNSELDGITE
jgi:hypothetical protein